MRAPRILVGLTLMAGGLVLWGVALHRLLGYDARWSWAIPVAILGYLAGAAINPWRRGVLGALGWSGLFTVGGGVALAAGLTDGGAARSAELTVGVTFLAVGLVPAALAAPALGGLLTAGRGRSPASTLEAVQRLEQLRNEGRLTDEEFEAAQAKLLEGR